MKTLVAAMAVFALLGGCTGAPTQTKPADERTFVSLTAHAPDTLDPAAAYEGAGIHVIQNVYETLYSYLYYRGIVTTQVRPQLAAEMPTYDATRTQLTIPLRPGVHFHDGSTMTADDVKFSLDRILLMRAAGGPSQVYAALAGASEYLGSSGTAADRAAYLASGAVEVVDPLTVRIRLAYTDPSFLPRLAFSGSSVVSRDWICDRATAADCLPPTGERDANVTRRMMGTGPFALESWTGEEVVLRRWDGYWGEPPELDRVVIHAVTDADERVRTLLAGEADDANVPVDRAATVVGRSGIRVVEDLSFNVAWAGFNQAFCGAAGVERGACMGTYGAWVPRAADGAEDPGFFGDAHMRRAWVLAFDYAEYQRDVIGAHGSMLNGAIPRGIFGHDPDAPLPERDLDEARRELAASRHPDGFRVVLLYPEGTSIPQRAAELLARSVEELSPDVEVEAVARPFGDVLSALVRGGAPVVFLSWLPDYAFPDNYLLPFAHSQQGILASALGIQDPELDRSLERLQRESDETALRDGYRDAVERLNANATYLWLEQTSNFHVEREWVRGYLYNPMSAGSPNVGNYATVSKAD